MDRVVLQPVNKTLEVDGIKTMQTEDGKWTVIGEEFISRSYENVTKKGDYLLAYYTPSEFHIYGFRQLICTSDGELLECLNAKSIEGDVLEVIKTDETSCIIIGQDVFDILSIKHIIGKKHYGVAFLEKSGTLYLKAHNIDLDTIIEQGCERCSVMYQCVEYGDIYAHITMSITGEMKNKEKRNYLIYFAPLHEKTRYEKLEISEEVICFYSNDIGFALTQLDETGRKKLYSIRDLNHIETEFSADGVDSTSGYIIFWKNTPNGKVYTEMYNKFKGKRLLREIIREEDGKEITEGFEKREYSGINEKTVHPTYNVVILEKQIDGKTHSFLITEGKEILIAESKIIIRSIIEKEDYISIEEDSGKHTIVWIVEDSIQKIEMIAEELKVNYCSLQTLVISVDGHEDVYQAHLM